MHKIETSTSIILLSEEGIGHIHFKDFAYYDLPEEQEQLLACKTITGNFPHPFVVTTGEHVIFTKQVRHNYSKVKDQMLVSAIALVVNNLAYRLIAQFYIKMQKHIHPIKIFTDKEQAFEWCKQFVQIAQEK